MVARTLSFALDHGFLRYELDGGRCNWRWVDEVPSTCVPVARVRPVDAEASLPLAQAPV
jgi:hypothetical protein